MNVTNILFFFANHSKTSKVELSWVLFPLKACETHQKDKQLHRTVIQTWKHTEQKGRDKTQELFSLKSVHKS